MRADLAGSRRRRPRAARHEPSASRLRLASPDDTGGPRLRRFAFVSGFGTGDHVDRPPLFRDPFAVAFLEPSLLRATRLARVLPLRRAIERYADYQVPGARTSAIARTRFIDDALVAAVGAGSSQVVILGAGYDCRAHRLPALRAAEVFEVDRAETQAVKRTRLGAREVHGALRYVAVDFATDDLEASLVAAGWQSDEPAAFVWEGVTNYLSDAAVSKVLSLVGKSAAGGRLIFTYMHQGVLDGSLASNGDAFYRIAVAHVARDT